MTSLGCLLFLVSSAAQADPPNATIRQQAEIITLIEQARDVVDNSQYEPDKYRTAYGKALNDKIEFEKAMGLRDGKGKLLPGKPAVPTKEDLKKISGDWLGRNDKRDKYAEAARVVQKAEKKSVESYQKALDLTWSYYGIGPKGEAGKPINGPPWERERWLAWDPKFSAVPEPHEKEDMEKAFERQPAFIRGIWRCCSRMRPCM